MFLTEKGTTVCTYMKYYSVVLRVGRGAKILVLFHTKKKKIEKKGLTFAIDVCFYINILPLLLMI